MARQVRRVLPAPEIIQRPNALTWRVRQSVREVGVDTVGGQLAVPLDDSEASAWMLIGVSFGKASRSAFTVSSSRSWS